MRWALFRGRVRRARSLRVVREWREEPPAEARGGTYVRDRAPKRRRPHGKLAPRHAH